MISNKKTISIVGGGASALLFASFLDSSKYEISIYEQNKSLGRKMLVAGKGGFNLTRAEPISQLITRYFPQYFLETALLHFDNQALRNWLKEIGIPTFVGSSKRVFPEKEIKPIQVLQAIITKIKANSVLINFEKKWIGWTPINNLLFEDGTVIQSDFNVFALGGGSWKVTGSTGNWLDTFNKKEVPTQPFSPVNCAFKVHWNSNFLKINEGKPLKNIAIQYKNKYQKGELVITKFGLEGNAIYALSREIQEQRSKHKKAIIHLDLKPIFDYNMVLTKLKSSKLKVTETLRKDLKLSKVQVNLLKSIISKDDFLDKIKLAKAIKGLPIKIVASAPIDEAISTIGGIDLCAIDDYFELKNLKNNYCIGEMLDWYAPTGGYLLQGCFSMGAYLAERMNRLELS